MMIAIGLLIKDQLTSQHFAPESFDSLLRHGIRSSVSAADDIISPSEQIDAESSFGSAVRLWVTVRGT